MRTPRTPQDAPASRLPAPPARGRRAHAGPPADEYAGYAGRPGDRAGEGPRRPGLRPATVRAKIISLLMVPVVSLLALWALAAVGTAQDVSRLSRLQRVDEQIRIPVGRAVTELQAERRAAVRYLAAPGAVPAAALTERGRRTDTAVAALRLGPRHTVADSGDQPPAVARSLRAFVAAAEALAADRAALTARETGADTAFDSYTEVIGTAFAVQGTLAEGGAGTAGTAAGAARDTGSRVLLEFARATEQLSREEALLAGADAAADAPGGPGTLPAETVRRFTAAAESRRTLTEAAAPDLPAVQRAQWERTARSSGYAALTAAEDALLAPAPERAPEPAPAAGNGATTGTGSGTDSSDRGTGTDAGTDGDRARGRTVPAGWEAAVGEVAAAMRAVETGAHQGAAHRVDPLVSGVLSASGGAVLLGLLAVAASLVISVRIGRGLVVELVALRNDALDIARRKLPYAMDRLRAGQEIDVAAEAPVGPRPEDEIAEVAEALATVHRAALDAAVERAELAGGISGVFVNLARRSQVLVHRQLTLLDSMERRADDPGELGDLFRLDHLTTRMRRHAESLIILSGAAPGRAWRTPVPLTNVVRAAVSEIEDYPRVEVHRLPEAAVIGGAVADLTHLLAELIENAAQFSPPHTKVRVSGEQVGTGYVLEVEDRGLGMGRDTLAEANRRIEQSEGLDLFDSDRLGLFVVSRLSARHGIRVHLRTSPYGGTTAVVLLPAALLQGALPVATPTAGAAGDPRDGSHRGADAQERSGDGRSGGVDDPVAARPVPQTVASGVRGGGADADVPGPPFPGADRRPVRPADRYPAGEGHGTRGGGHGGAGPAPHGPTGPAHPAGTGPESARPDPLRPDHGPRPDRPVPVGTLRDGVPHRAEGRDRDGDRMPGAGPAGGSTARDAARSPRAAGPAGHEQGTTDRAGSTGAADSPAAGAAGVAGESRPATVATLRPRGAQGPRTGRTGPPPAAGPQRSGPGGAGPGLPDPMGPLPAGVTALPRRVRQASLVPQLREYHGPDGPGPRSPRTPADRSPEDARDRMAAYRDGWARGTAEDTHPTATTRGEDS
ncbi:nitrate- and nitrite sensing domain-containing protein [Streptomyces sp. NPDC097619]|uniref:nitrate- and nitrite sensing domain-containing protein n=1 Tax=Streptomyces sp. NPDC097619 TaxID=3157228 RepID=UPI003327F706